MVHPISPYLFNMVLAAALRIALVRFSQYQGIVRDSVQPDDAGAVGTGDGTDEQELMARSRKGCMGMLCAHDAGIVSKGAEGLAK